jgi:hypothetical protein
VEEQLSKLRSSDSPSLRVLKLRDSGASQVSGASGLRLERLDRDPIAEDSPSRPAALARSDPGRTGTTGAGARPRWMVPAGAALVVATALLIGWLARSKGNADEVKTPLARPEVSAAASTPPIETAPAGASAAPPASVATPVVEGTIHVSLSAQVPGAEFAIDGEPKARSPVLITKARDKQVHRITATAPGHRPETKGGRRVGRPPPSDGEGRRAHGRSTLRGEQRRERSAGDLGVCADWTQETRDRSGQSLRRPAAVIGPASISGAAGRAGAAGRSAGCD